MKTPVSYGRMPLFENAYRMFKQAVQQAGRRIVLLYVEPRREARTPLATCFNILPVTQDVTEGTE